MMKKVIFAVAVAAVLWTLMFSPLTAPRLDFWWMMTGSACLLTLLSTLFRPHWWRGLSWTPANILLGVALAAVLWGIFWTGDKVSSWLFNFARPQVDAIYGIKEGTSACLLSFLLLFLIGPAEEIFWRGYVQHTFSIKWGRNTGFIVTSLIYALVHAPSCNFMLVMAAFVAGVVWGAVYRFFPERFPAVVISHAMWDAAVFVWFPI